MSDPYVHPKKYRRQSESELKIPAVMFSVARDGEVVGEFSEAEFARKIRSQEIRSTDHYFVEGMADWKPVYEYIPSATLPPTPSPESVKSASDRK